LNSRARIDFYPFQKTVVVAAPCLCMAARATVSQKIRSAVWARRAAGDKVHHLAQLADVHPSIFSALVNDITPIKPGDPRVFKDRRRPQRACRSSL
jgi:hypothetical protein